MHTISGICNQGWLGSLLGLVGVVLAVVFFLRGRTRLKLTYTVTASRIVDKEDIVVSDRVSFLYDGRPVERLSAARLTFWNAGNRTLVRDQLLRQDPLRVEITQPGEILSCRIVRVTRKVNQVALQPGKEGNARVPIAMDFLDPEDGAVVELLHTSEVCLPQLKGTIRGVPKGPSRVNGRLEARQAKWVALLTLMSFTYGMLTVMLYCYGERVSRAMTPRGSAMLAGAAGVAALLLALLIAWRARRAPRQLRLQQIGEEDGGDG